MTYGRRQFLRNSGAVLGVTALGGCAPLAQAGPADVLIVNGRVATLNPRQPEAAAIAIRGDSIVGVGSEAELNSFRDEKTRVIDAGRRTVIPGLNDAHTHFIRGGLTYTNEVRWDGLPSLAEGMRRVGEQARRTPPPHWVQVIGGWTWAQFAEKRFPSLEEINAATGDTPCMIMHLYDRAWLNRSAIRVLGWEREVPKLFGGFVERDAGGNPTGLVMSTTSLASLVAIWLRVPRLSPEEQISSTRHFMREHNRLGVTSVIDAGGGGQNYPENYAAIAKLAADNLLTLRIGYELFAQAPGKELDNYLAWSKLVRIGEGNDYYRMIGAGEYVLYAAGDPANFAKDWGVAPPGVMESQFTAVTKHLVGLRWPFRQHTTFDSTPSRVLNVLEQVNRDVPLQGERNLLDRTAALRLYTSGGAWMSSEEDKKGTLEIGKLADLVILSADYFSVPEEGIKEIESLLTMVGGKPVYGAGPYAMLDPPSLPTLPDWLPVRHYGGGPKGARAPGPPPPPPPPVPP